jgi:Na+/melibiose symporter-like transporter
MNIMMYYIVYIMKGADIGNELLTSAIQYIINVAMTLPAILYLDRIGRRPALIFGAFFMMVWLFISGTFLEPLASDS